jgi:NADH dehydrogenase [ubiquinone] 1 alpha subcomplex assembly factor 3
VIGPTVLFPRYAISWNIETGKDITEEALSLFTVVEPKPDVLIIGLDDRYDFAYHRNLKELTKKLHITTEILSVHYACTAFNFMNEEGRNVVAALIPPMQSSISFQMLSKTESKEQITDSGGTVDNEKLLEKK